MKLDKKDILIILDVWQGRFDHKDQAARDQAAITHDKLYALLRDPATHDEGGK